MTNNNNYNIIIINNKYTFTQNLPSTQQTQAFVSEDSKIANTSIKYSSVCTPEEPYGSSNGGLPIPMWGCDLGSNGHGRHTTRITSVLAFWQTSDNVILVMFGTS
jgi:hypothetical protein